MIRSAYRRACACLLAGLLGVAVLTVPVAVPGPLTARATAAEATPLSVSISQLSPSTIPRRGRITVTGEVSNNSAETWTNLNVYLLTSPEPFTGRDALAAAAATDPASEFGGRITDPGLFVDVGDLAPGSSTSYRLSVPRSALQISGEPGVYWLGVHVLGASRDGRDVVADGRVRTFVPLMESRNPRTALSLVMALKQRVRRGADGRLLDLDAWQDALASEGRLNRLLELSGTSQSTPVTWVVDPAVLDAVRTVATDNDEFVSLATTGDGGEEAGDSGEGADTGDGAEVDLSGPAQAADDWLKTLVRQSAQHTVFAVPYGEADVAAMTRREAEDLYRTAVELSAQTMEALDIDARPILAPTPGFLPPAALRQAGGVRVLLSDAAAPGAAEPVIRTRTGQQIVLTETAAGSVGPGAAPRSSALAMRQRILSEAALHALSDDRDQPLVVVTPPRWDPGPGWRSAEFFAGLRVPWLSTVDLPTATTPEDTLRPEETIYDERLRYPARLRRAEIPLPNLLATQDLVGKGRLLAAMLSRNDRVDRTLAKTAMLGSSIWARATPRAAAQRVRLITAEVRNQLDRVEVEGPSFVTMSSQQGTFTVTLINGLDEPVLVGVEANTAGDDLRISAPRPVELAGGQRASIRLRAAADEIGVHAVTLTPVTVDGEPLGDGTRFNVRSSEVGFVIWIILGVGAAVLFVASAAQITRRVRQHREDRTAPGATESSGRGLEKNLR